MYVGKTTAEQLTDINKIIKYTLWRAATSASEPLRNRPQTHQDIINDYLQGLFANKAWIAEVAGSYAARLVSEGADGS